MAVDIPKPDTKAEQLLLALVERMDALLEVLAEPAPEPTPAAPRKRAPRGKDGHADTVR